jgi:hypothetical protein
MPLSYLEKLSCNIILRTHLLYMIFIRSFIVVIIMYPVLKIMHVLDFLDTSSLGVTVTVFVFTVTMLSQCIYRVLLLYLTQQLAHAPAVMTNH